MKNGVYLIEIIKPLSHMPLDRYIQFSSYNSHNKRFFINKGAAGSKSIGLKSVVVLASPLSLSQIEPKFKFISIKLK